MLPTPVMPLVVAAVEDGRWTLGLGDPTPMGWATVGGSLMAAVLCLLWAKPPGAGRLLPLSLAFAMTLLAANKQLDLQSLLTELGREAAEAQGWYEDRRTFQWIFIAAIGGAATLGLAALLWILRRRWRESGLALAGVAFLLAFVVIRAASFHQIDQGLGETWIGMRLNGILELGGIALVGVGGLVGWRFRLARSSRIADSLETEAVKRVSEDQEATVPDSGVPIALDEPPMKPVRPARSVALEGFVVRPIRISEGPRARPHPDRTSPPRVVS